MALATLNPAIPFAPAKEDAPGAATDAALMERVQTGDLDAFEPIVRRYERRLFGYFLNLVEDPEAAADLAQETFLRVWRAAPRYRESGQFEAWLFRIAANLVRSRRRKLSHRTPHLPIDELPAAAAADLPEAAPGHAVDEPPEQSAWRSEVREALRNALPRLPLVFREAVLLRDLEGWSYREIAEMLGVEEGTVKSRAHRGRKHLRELLAPRFGEPSLEAS